MYQTLLTEIDAGVGIITLNRPDRHNAFDALLISELSTVIDIMAAEPAVRVIILSSTGKSFCAGTAGDWVYGEAPAPEDQQVQSAHDLAELFQRLAQCPKPVIARVQGAAQGEGVGLIAVCDIAITTFDASFAVTDVTLGLVPGIIAPYVVAAIGERYARRYLLTAERFSAAEAYRIGLVHEMVMDEAALDDALGDTVDALLGNSPNAIHLCKDLVAAVAARPLTPGMIDDSVRRTLQSAASSDGREGVAARREKRNPFWIQQRQ